VKNKAENRKKRRHKRNQPLQRIPSFHL